MFNRLHAYGPKREMKATAGRAFDLCTILHQLTEAEQRFKNTNRITEPPIVRAARKWKRLALRNKEVFEFKFLLEADLKLRNANRKKNPRNGCRVLIST